MLSWLKKLFSDDEKKARRRYQPLVDTINNLEPDYHPDTLSDEDLRAKTDEFRARLKEGETLDDVLPEAFATVREASRRTIGMRHYDVQLIGGAVMHSGKIAEMRTGEGKTLVATLPLYLNALEGKGVHLVTVNDYLARRDAGWMGPVYHLLGMTVGCIGHDLSALFDPDFVDPTTSLDDERLVHWRPCSRHEAYAADIVYGTNNEFGFDYLRDNMVHRFEQVVQRSHTYAIVDEVDNILIDEARTPLIISGPASKSSNQYARFAGLVSNLRAGTVTPDEVKKKIATPDGDVLLELKSRSVLLTEEGLAKVEAQIEELGEGESVYDPQHSTLTHYLENALKAKFIYQKDKDYVIQDGEIVIVDEFTGRMMPGRRWSDGLHQAVEAKEGVDVRRESVTYATITFQNYFRMYDKLSGMTGTAATEREEFGKIYNLEVEVIPTNRPCIRADHTDQIYRSEAAKFNSVIHELRERALAGQPILVGTTAVETSERLSNQIKRDMKDLLSNKQAFLHVLNAKQNADEASIVAQAGQPSTITIATNMAGRGTDILLGGNPESLAARHLRDTGVDRKQIEELAQSLFSASSGNQKTPRATPETLIERSRGKLTSDMIESLNRLHDWYEHAAQQIETEGETIFLIKTTLADFPHIMYEHKRELVRAVLQHNIPRARRLLRDFPGAGEEKIVEIQHIYADSQAYISHHRDRANFLAGKLFDHIYTERARLVQLTLRGKLEEARAVVEATPGLTPDYIDDILRIQRECEENHERVKEAGGLHVVGTERHEARRIDNQLRGRSGRQGDPGSSRFYLSLEDELMKRFGRMDTLRKFMERLRVDDDMPIEAGIISKSIESAQTRVEGYNFDIRKHTVDYDNVMNKQREVIYTRRRRILEEANERRRITSLLDRYYKPTRIFEEVRDELSATVSLDTELARQRIKRLLPDVAFDLATLRAASSDDLPPLLRPLIKQQQQHSMPVLVDELRDILEMPDDSEDVLRQSSHAKAKNYVLDLWREQRGGDLEDRIKDMFEQEFIDLTDRYIVNYESWLRGEISVAISDATNPATDDVNVPLVQRKLAAILPEVTDYDTADLDGLSADRLQRELEAHIPANRENGHNIDLFTNEIMSLMPTFPSHRDLIFQNLTLAGREQLRERYIENYQAKLDILTNNMPEDERNSLREDAIENIRQELRPLFNPSARPLQEDSVKIYNTINDHNRGVIGDTLECLTPEAIQDTLNEIIDQTFDHWRDAIGDAQLTTFQRSLMLQTIDREWQEYLTAMEDLRQGIGLQAIGQRDPLVQYQTQGYRMFNELLANIDHTVVRNFFQRLPEHQRHLEQYQAEKERQEKAARAGYELVGGRTTTKNNAKRTVRRETPKVGPNDPCPCGSGKKYKHCHGAASAKQQHIQRGKGNDDEGGDLVAVASSGGKVETASEESASSPDTRQEQPAPRGRAVPGEKTPPRGRTAPPATPRKKKKSKR